MSESISKRSYWCENCGQELDREDVEDGLSIGDSVAIFCPSCEQYTIVDIKGDEEEKE